MSPKILLLSASILCFAGLQSLSAALAGPEIISEPLPAPKAAAPQIIIAPQIAQGTYILAQADSASADAAVKKAVKKKAKAKAKKSKAATNTATEKKPRKSRSKKAETAQSQTAAPAGSAGAVKSGAKTYTPAAGNNNCSCASATYCIGPRNGHYCYSASGKKRYLRHNK